MDIDDHVRLVPQSDGTVLIWLPYVDYLDTQAGPVEVGLNDAFLRQLHEALSAHLGADTRTEYGARFEDGTTMLRPSRELAECTVRAIQGRHGDGRLMSRQVLTTAWTEAAPTA
jgi:hypothetical protein